jgi:hypothetical protein
MKKKVYFTVSFFVLISTFVFAQISVTRDGAYKIIKQKGLVDTLNYNVKVSKQIILPNTILDFMGDSIKSPEWDSWFFLIDMHPFAEWAHPCKYVFVNTIDTSLVIISGQLGPSFPTDVLLRKKVEAYLPTPVFNKKKP